MAIQDDFDIEHQGLFVSPLGVGSSLMFKTQLFLLFHPVLRSCECFKPGRIPNGLVVRKLLPIYHVSQLDLGADLEHEARFDMLHDLALDLFGDGAFQVQVEAKQDRSPALFYSMFATLIDLVELRAEMLWVVQWIKLFHEFVRKSPLTYDLLLFVKPSIQLLPCVTTPLSPGALHEPLPIYWVSPPCPGRIPGRRLSPIGYRFLGEGLRGGEGALGKLISIGGCACLTRVLRVEVV